MFVIALQGPGLPGLGVEGGRLPAGKWRAAYVRWKAKGDGKAAGGTYAAHTTRPSVLNCNNGEVAGWTIFYACVVDKSIIMQYTNTYC